MKAAVFTSSTCSKPSLQSCKLAVNHSSSCSRMPSPIRAQQQQQRCCHCCYTSSKRSLQQTTEAQQGCNTSPLQYRMSVAGVAAALSALGVTASTATATAAEATAAAGAAAAVIVPVDPSTYVPGPVEVGWQIWFAAVVSTIPFIIGAYEFGKRIVIQRRCAVCQGSGLVQKGRYQRKCPQCGGFFPWISWQMFLSANARPGNGGPLMQPRGQTSVFYKVPPRPEEQQAADSSSSGGGIDFELPMPDRQQQQQQSRPTEQLEDLELRSTAAQQSSGSSK